MIIPKFWQDVLNRRWDNTFVGRREELDFFRRNLGLPPTDPEKKSIIFIQGQGGMGKTMLVNKFRNLATEKGRLTGLVNDCQKDIPDVLYALAEQFARAGYALEGFMRCYRDYRAKTNEVTTDLSASEEAVQRLVAGIIRMIRRMPFAGIPAELLDENRLSEQVKEFIGSLNRKFKNKDNADLSDRPVETLSRAFVKDFNKVFSENKNKPMVLFFDAFETIGTYLDAWLRNLLMGCFGELPMNLLFVLAGRAPLNQNWTAFPLIHQIRLQRFSKDEAALYLRKHEILHDNTIEAILRFADGIPHLLALMVSQEPQAPSDVNDSSGDAVNLFLKDVKDLKLREAAINAAFPIVLNQDIFAFIVNSNEANALFDDLKTMPFVKQITDGWIFDDSVRGQMIRYARKASPSKWEQLHENFAAYFLQKTIAEESSPRRDTAKFSRAYWLYHRLCHTPESALVEALDLFFEALATNWAHAEMIIKMLQWAGVDTSTKKIEDYGNRLANMVEKNDWEGKYIQLSAWHQVASHLIKNQGRSLKTLDHLIKANTKDLSMIWMIVRRGKIHRSMGNDQDALKDFGLAIELLEQNQLVIAQRSATFGLSQNDDKQDDSFDRFLQEISEEIKKKKEMSMAVPNVLLGLNPDSFDRMFLEANKAFLC
jgi:hypothetical protein